MSIRGCEVDNRPSIQSELNTLPSYLENIINKKVTNAALTCFESLVHWFLTTFSCCYPAYERLYRAEVAKLSPTNAESLAMERNPIPTEEQPQEMNIPGLGSAKVMHFLRGGEFRDGTDERIADLRISDEVRSNDDKPYQYLAVKSPKTQEYYKVLLCDGPDEPIQTYFDLSNEDVVTVGGGWDMDAISIRVQSGIAGAERMYFLDFNNAVYPRTYTDSKGNPCEEKVYITATDAEFKHHKDLRRRLSVVLPNLIPADEPLEPVGVITPFLRKGQLNDFTEGAIAGLKISEETHPDDEKPYECLTLNGHRVVLCRNSQDGVEIRTHFNLSDEDEIAVSNFPREGFVRIEERNRISKIVKDWPGFLAITTLLYEKTYTDPNGNTRTENVCITDVSDRELEIDVPLRRQLGVVWPPARN